MNKIILIFIIFLTGCMNSGPSSQSPTNETNMGDGIFRYEFKDVICYTYYTAAMSCFKKDKK